MDMAGPLILIANPGSASRKYALYEGKTRRAWLHMEEADGWILCTGQGGEIQTDIHDIARSAQYVAAVFEKQGALQSGERIEQIGLRVVAPSSFFLEDRVITDEVVSRLEDLLPRAPLHITATLSELKTLRAQFPDTQIVGISDSAFHGTKPDYAWNYGLPLADADRLDIKRFGYHGLSVASVVKTLEAANKLPPKLIVCHLGSGASVTAVHGGKSLDTTMGYSPLEGVIMATRSGSIDPTAVNALKHALRLGDDKMEVYLNTQGGLLGLGGSSDLRVLLQREDSDHHARLAIQTYVFSIQKAIGQMVAALDGVDALVFTGTVGERSAPIRHLIVQKLRYLDLAIDEQANGAITESPKEITTISERAALKPICIVTANESDEMVRRLLQS